MKWLAAAFLLVGFAFGAGGMAAVAASGKRAERAGPGLAGRCCAVCDLI